MPGDRCGSVNPTRSKARQCASEGCPPECTGRPLEGVGNGVRRWMVATRTAATSCDDRTRRIGRPIPRPPGELQEPDDERGPHVLTWVITAQVTGGTGSVRAHLTDEPGASRIGRRVPAAPARLRWTDGENAPVAPRDLHPGSLADSARHRCPPARLGDRRRRRGSGSLARAALHRRSRTSSRRPGPNSGPRPPTEVTHRRNGRAARCPCPPSGLLCEDRRGSRTQARRYERAGLQLGLRGRSVRLGPARDAGSRAVDPSSA